MALFFASFSADLRSLPLISTRLHTQGGTKGDGFMRIFSTRRSRVPAVTQRVRSGQVGMAGLVAGVIMLIAGSAQATMVYNTSLASPGTYYGTGNPNTNWVVDNANGVEIGLQTLIRYVGSVAPTPTGSSIYYVPIGATTVTGKSGSAWGFAFSLNLSGAGLTLSDVTTSLQMQDLANGTTGAFDALLIPDNYGYSLFGRDGGSAASPLNPSIDYGVQNAEALSYSSVASALGDPGYNMNQNEVYNFLFSVTCNIESCMGEQLASVNSTVIAGNGMAVPEPSSIGIFGTGLVVLLGLGLAGRRRLRAMRNMYEV